MQSSDSAELGISDNLMRNTNRKLKNNINNAFIQHNNVNIFL